MVILIAVLAVGIVAAVAVVKHGSLAAALTSAKKEAANLEALAEKIEGDVKTEVLALVARLKAL
jgi:hypothetical protein